MTALAHENCVPAYPLGQPEDGRKRYGMTPEQAHIYRWLVKNRPHDEPFAMDFRTIGSMMGCSCGTAHFHIRALIDRGWIKPHGKGARLTGRYAFVQPVKHFAEPRG